MIGVFDGTSGPESMHSPQHFIFCCATVKPMACMPKKPAIDGWFIARKFFQK